MTENIKCIFWLSVGINIIYYINVYVCMDGT